MTPDLKPGDVVSVSLGTNVLADMIIQDGLITSVKWDGNKIIRINGKVAQILKFVLPIPNSQTLLLVDGMSEQSSNQCRLHISSNTIFVATFTFDAVTLATICNSGAFPFRCGS